MGDNTQTGFLGIHEINAQGASTTNLYHNTIYIGGTQATGAGPFSYALRSNNSTTFNKNIKNNILVNARSGGSVDHLALNAAAPAAGGTLNCDYNNYYASGVSGKLGSWGGTLVTTGHVIVTGQDVNSYAGSPVFSNAGGTNAVDYIPSPTISTLNGVTISGITTDFAGNTRVTPKMGAFESSFVSGIQNISGLTLTDNSALTVLNGAHLTIDASKTLNSITVERGGKLTNASGQTLTLTTLNLKSDASGTATYVDNGTSVITTGNVQQYLTGGRNWYISSPVASSARSVITNATTVYKFNEPTLAWQTESTSLTPMIGYIATTNTTGTSTFTGGALNTGSQTLSNLAWSAADATKKGFNLIGNPYPSYIDWEQTTKTGLSTTMWYRSRNSGNTAYVFDTYNGTSHEGTSLNGSIVTQFIPPMQAFWVRATSATNTFSATNNMRSHESGTNRLKAKAVDSQQVLRLRVSNNVNSDETLVLFNQNALNGFDDYDSPKMSNNTVSIPEIYTQIGDQKLVMNGMNVVKYETEILLGFATGEANNFSITNTQMANFDTGTKLILKDKLLSTEKDLTDGSPYDFESGVTNTNDRFSLIFRAQGTSTGIDNVEKGNTQAFVNSANKITIIAPEKSNYAIYNAVGQLIENGVTTSNHQTSTFNLQPGVYMVRVNNQSTRVIVK